MNKQEIFDTVVNHLFTQGRPAAHGSSCKYRTDTGLKCAVGVFIPDDMYSVGMEGKDVAGLIFWGEDEGYDLPDLIKNKENTNLLRDLQKVHDESRSKVETKGGWGQISYDYHPFTTPYLNMGFRLVADKYDLNYSPR